MTFENEINPNEEINSNKRSHTNTLIPWPHYINYKGEIVRKIDEVFIFWLVLLPIFAYWFLFGDGYTTKAKVGWGLYAIFIWPSPAPRGIPRAA
jgi:hypothetical protein